MPIFKRKKIRKIGDLDLSNSEITPDEISDQILSEIKSEEVAKKSAQASPPKTVIPSDIDDIKAQINELRGPDMVEPESSTIEASITSELTDLQEPDLSEWEDEELSLIHI